MDKPKFSVSEITTFRQTFAQDVETYVAAGAEGIGVWEFKLAQDGDDTEALAALADAGLKATTCIPRVLSIFPVPFPGPTDPQERTVELCRAIERFAPFQPEVVLAVTGHPGPGADPVESRRVLVEGLRKAARVAAANGLTLGVEPLHRNVYGTWSTIGTLPETIALIDEIGEDNVKVLFDVYHLWDTDDVLADIARYGDRISPSIHICDWRAETRNDFDRALPGEGVMDLPALFGALDAAGAIDWVDLEIFSDDGSFSDQDFHDSLWKLEPAEVLARGKAGFDAAWEARKAPA